MASQVCDSQPSSPGDFVDHDTEDEFKHAYPPPDAIRMVGIRKVAGEHLVGVTDARNSCVAVLDVQEVTAEIRCFRG